MPRRPRLLPAAKQLPSAPQGQLRRPAGAVVARRAPSWPKRRPSPSLSLPPPSLPPPALPRRLAPPPLPLPCRPRALPAAAPPAGPAAAARPRPGGDLAATPGDGARVSASAAATSPWLLGGGGRRSGLGRGAAAAAAAAAGEEERDGEAAGAPQSAPPSLHCRLHFQLHGQSVETADVPPVHHLLLPPVSAGEGRVRLAGRCGAAEAGPAPGRVARAEPGRGLRRAGHGRGRWSGFTAGWRQERAGSPLLPCAAAPGVPPATPGPLSGRRAPTPSPRSRCAVSDLAPSLSPSPSRRRSLLFPKAPGVSPPSQPRP